jgi:hypothetical protein
MYLMAILLVVLVLLAVEEEGLVDLRLEVVEGLQAVVVLVLSQQ